MLFEALVTLLAVTRTTNLAARVTGVRTFLPALAPKRLALMAGMDEDIVARQMDDCTSFNDDAWFQYWTKIAFAHIDELDKELEKAGLSPIKEYIRGGKEAPPPPPPEVCAYLGVGTVLLQSTPVGSQINMAELTDATPTSCHGSLIAMEAALKATAYLFQASWPGRTPKRDEAYAMSTRLFDIILDACAPVLGIQVLRHVLKSHGEEIIMYGLIRRSTQPGVEALPSILVTNGLEGTNAESMLPFLRERDDRFYEGSCFFMEMPGTYAYKAPMSLGVTERIYADAISFIESLDYVDNSRIGMVGLSFGGHWTTRMAIVDKRLKAVVINGAPLRHSLRPSGAFGMPQIMIETLARAIGANIVTLPAKLSALAPSQDELRSISCHVLAINGDSDTLVATGDTVELAALAPHGCLKLYTNDDHCAMAHAREWAEFSVDWMQMHLEAKL